MTAGDREVIGILIRNGESINIYAGQSVYFQDGDELLMPGGGGGKYTARGPDGGAGFVGGGGGPFAPITECKSAGGKAGGASSSTG